MSPRSRKRRKASVVRGAKAPTISSRLGTIEAFLRGDVMPLFEAQQRQLIKPGELGVTGTSVPPIKPRLEALIGRASSLNIQLDQLSNNIVGDGVPAGETSSGKASPFSIPDQLEALENLLLRACERLDGIANRF